MKFQFLVISWFLCGVAFSAVSENQTNHEAAISKNALSKNSKSQKKKVQRAVAHAPPQRHRSVKELVYDLVKGTVIESEDVYRNISRTFFNTFTTTTTTPSPDEVESDGANSTTTTAAPFTLRDFYRLVGINYKGLNRLFLKEFQLALRDSVNNVGQFRNDLRLSFFPFLRPDPNLNPPHNASHPNATSPGS